MDPAQTELLAWYAARARDLPWRRTRDPYRILVSEVMLQQTQVDRVLPFYARFLACFPDERTLAAASHGDLHRAWKGLGYPSRADRLQAACRSVLDRNGRWPDQPEDLEALPGIGPYTAAAVACFAFARPVPLVDTNVARVFVRRDRLAAGDRKTLWAHAAAQLCHEQPIAWNNALMELGATVCTARRPDCGVCPWAERCRSRDDDAAQTASANPLRVASPKARYGHVLPAGRLRRQHVVLALIHHQGRYLVAQRRPDGPQAGRWELPGGKREPGEDDRRTLAREVLEELGTEVLAARHLLDWHHVEGALAITFHLYRTTLFAPGTVRPLAATRLRWVTPGELLLLDFPSANQPILERLRKYHRLRPNGPRLRAAWDRRVPLGR